MLRKILAAARRLLVILLSVVLGLAVLVGVTYGWFWWMHAVDNGVISISGDSGSVDVKGHTRKDGTAVKPHTRKKPRN
jgi:hypothetical protein